MKSTNTIKKKSESEDFDLVVFILRYLTYWPLFLLLIIISLSISFLYIRYKNPVFLIKSNILIKDEKKGMDGANILESLDLFGSKKIIENEIEVIKSKSIVKQVVNNLQLYAPIYRDGLVKDLSAYTLSPVKIIVQNPDSLVEINKTYFSYDENRKTIKLDNAVIPLNNWFKYHGNMLCFIPNNHHIPPKATKPLYFYLINVKNPLYFSSFFDMFFTDII